MKLYFQLTKIGLVYGSNGIDITGIDTEPNNSKSHYWTFSNFHFTILWYPAVTILGVKLQQYSKDMNRIHMNQYSLHLH